jgi:hypothetical protein
MRDSRDGRHCVRYGRVVTFIDGIADGTSVECLPANERRNLDHGCRTQRMEGRLSERPDLHLALDPTRLYEREERADHRRRRPGMEGVWSEAPPHETNRDTLQHRAFLVRRAARFRLTHYRARPHVFTSRRRGAVRSGARSARPPARRPVTRSASRPSRGSDRSPGRRASRGPTPPT